MLKQLNEIYGTHLSKVPGIQKVLEYVVSLNLKTLQVFTKSPQRFVKITSDFSDIEKGVIEKLIKSNGIKLFIHAQYILNLCRTDLPYAIHSVIEDFEYLDNVQGVVIHMGKDTKDLGYTQAFDNMKNNILTILSKIAGKQGNLILEFAVKSKNDVCNFSQIEGLAKLYEALGRHSKVKFCIDTCHIFASGYDIRTPKKFDEFIKKFDDLIGLSALQLFHLNDSKNNLGSGVDRHEALGKGCIFKDNESALKHVVTFAIRNKISVITETDIPLEIEFPYIKKLFS